jgi:hypothetical protein
MTGPADRADRIAATEALMLAAAHEAGIRIIGDRRVNQEGAAVLLGAAVETLKNWRKSRGGPVYYPRGIGYNGVTYRVGDLAVFVERARMDPFDG